MRFDPADPAVAADPYPVHASLRAAGPQVQVQDRRRNPDDELLTALVQTNGGNDRLRADGVVAIGILLLNAGHQATVNVRLVLSLS